jgi:hypothetical protein
VIKQFVPRNGRTCNALAWNAAHPTQLAVGLDKMRADFSTLVWDVSHQGLPGAPLARGSRDTPSAPRSDAG